MRDAKPRLGAISLAWWAVFLNLAVTADSASAQTDGGQHWAAVPLLGFGLVRDGGWASGGMEAALEVMQLAVVVAEKGNRNAASDGGVGALLARTAIRAADMNVRINLPSVADEGRRASMAARAQAIAGAAQELEARAIAATGL